MIWSVMEKTIKICFYLPTMMRAATKLCSTNKNNVGKRFSFFIHTCASMEANSLLPFILKVKYMIGGYFQLQFLWENLYFPDSFGYLCFQGKKGLVMSVLRKRKLGENKNFIIQNYWVGKYKKLVTCSFNISTH